MDSRRSFLKKSALASGVLLMPDFLKAARWLPEGDQPGQKVLVVIQLSGGNDGLNTVIPVKNDLYYKLRPGISKAGSDGLKITDELYFNPAMEAMRELYDNGEVSVINGVGYPNPNRSHFRSTDIWHTASDSDQFLSTGWLGRYLDAACDKPHHALEVDGALSLALKGERSAGLAVNEPRMLYQTTREPYFQKVVEENDMLTEDNLGYLYKTMISTYESAGYVYDQSKIYSSNVDYPTNAFGKRMKMIGELIGSGCDTRVYYISLSGFDTHVGQEATQDRLLKIWSDSVGALAKDLKKSNRFDDTLIMTFSEFGRRVKQNGSRGTDHGTANNLFLVGGGLNKAGMYNELPSLADLDKNGDLKFSVDFREVYATILDRWLSTNSHNIIGQAFSNLDFI